MISQRNRVHQIRNRLMSGLCALCQSWNCEMRKLLCGMAVHGLLSCSYRQRQTKYLVTKKLCKAAWCITKKMYL